MILENVREICVEFIDNKFALVKICLLVLIISNFKQDKVTQLVI